MLPPEVLEELKDTLILELERASRANSFISVLAFKIMKEDSNVSSGLQDAISGLIRKIDRLFAAGIELVVVLPSTDKNGARIVKYKIVNEMLSAGVSYKDITKGLFVYPNDVKEIGLLTNWRNKEICDYMLQKVQEALKG